MNTRFRWIPVAACAGLCLQSPSPAAQAAPEPAAALLGDAFNKLMENQGHWAFTQTQAISGLTEALKRDTVLRVDPSRAYPDQFKPVMIEGKPPTPDKLDEFRSIGERVAKRRLQDQRDSKQHSGDELQLILNLHVVSPDLEHATVVAEDGQSVTFDVPLRTKGEAASSFNAFQVTARVNKARREFEHATFRQRAAMRVEVVAKVSDAAIDCEFTCVDPAFPAVITRETQQATVRVLFVKRLVRFEMKRTDFRRVTPYDERFGVKLGPIRAIQF